MVGPCRPDGRKLGMSPVDRSLSIKRSNPSGKEHSPNHVTGAITGEERLENMDPLIPGARENMPMRFCSRFCIFEVLGPGGRFSWII